MNQQIYINNQVKLDKYYQNYNRLSRFCTYAGSLQDANIKLAFATWKLATFIAVTFYDLIINGTKIYV